MRSEGDWKKADSLLNYLGLQLYRGRLCVFLGAGASMGLDLPNWQELLSRLLHGAGLDEIPGEQYADTAGRFRSAGCGRVQDEYLKRVSAALYRNAKLDLTDLVQQPALRAIGALLMASRRGSATAVTLNFDDVLEQYLLAMGFDIHAVAEPIDWARRQEVTIYHPHGFLPSRNTQLSASSQIVFARGEYDLARQRENWDWTPVLVNLLRSRTTLFIGLSGNDENLLQLMDEINIKHIAKREGTRYWGVSFDSASGKSESHRADLDSKWQKSGVYRHYLDSHGLLPELLLTICQRAARHAGNHAR